MAEATNVVVLNTRASIVVVGTHSLAPGENDIPREDLEAELKHPNGVVAEWFSEESGFLSVKAGAKKARPLAQSLTKLSVARAKDVIAKTDNAAVLQGYARSEKRSGVNKALTARIRELKAPPESEESEASEEAGDTTEG